MIPKAVEKTSKIVSAQPISQREVWLHKNSKAKAAVLRGLEQAKARKTAKSPDLEADARLVKQLEK